jgi:hypothetical protein
MVAEGVRLPLVLLTQNTHNMKKNISVGEAKFILAQHGYFVHNLWHIDDVKSRYDCSDADAMRILKRVFESVGTYDQIWFAIDYFASDLNLQPTTPQQ